MDKNLSIIVAAHHEGLIAHKTMLSIERAVKKLEAKKIRFEIIITIDNGDERTIDYFERYSTDKRITIHKLSFGDLALSRNYGISMSNGKYIAILDADDLVSENWLVDGVKILESSKDPLILHSQYSVNFGTQDIVWEKFDSRSKEEDALIMTWANRWDSACITKREIFSKFPFMPNNEGYGSEDWHFNSQTLAANIPHRIVPKSVLFVRRKDISLMTTQAADHRTLRYTDLLDIKFMKNIDTSKYIDTWSNLNRSKSPLLSKTMALFIKKLKSAHHYAEQNQFYYRFARILLSSKFQKNINSENDRFPKWLIKEWYDIHSIEKSIFPNKQLIDSIVVYHSEMYELGNIFCKLSARLSDYPDYIMFVPYMCKGGAELVALRYIDAIKSTHPDWHLAIIATEKGDNSWSEKIPNNVDFIPFGELSNHLPEKLRLQLLARLIVQSKAKRLHISQSSLMFRFANLYKVLLEPYKIYSFAFCEDTDNQGRVSGHVHSGLPYAYDVIDRVFTDNNSIIDKLANEYGYSKEKFTTHYQPVDTIIIKPRPRIDFNAPLRILWASRIAKQKRPDIVLGIAKKIPKSEFTIDVYGSFQDGFSKEIYKGINNISYKGQFNGIDSIDTKNYDVFLYTSENDGIPNILLEVAAKGLPIIAPNIGGIGEFISNSTGYLIENKEDIDKYVEALNYLRDNDSARIKLAKKAQDVITSKHSVDQFINNVRKDIA